jgi:predicted ATPase
LEQTIIEKAEGNPFFLEELTRAVIEHGDFHEDVIVPDTIQGVLMARIDRLPEEPKRLLQMASVLGREFSPRLLEAIWEGTGSLELLLSELKRLEFFYERTGPEEPIYVFKHALTQDVAYDSLLLATRRQLHQQISEAILAQHEDNLEEWVSFLAHHLAHSDDPSQALPYLVQTGERAQRVYANAEALRAFTQALDILDALPTTETTRRQRVDLTLRLASLHALLGHYGESLACNARALEEAEAAGDTKAVARLETHIGRVRYTMGDYEEAIACFHRALELAQRLHDLARMAVCYQSLGAVYVSSGSLPKAIECYMNALRIAEDADNQVGVATACIFLSNAHDRAGNIEEAVQWGRRALALGERLHDDRRIAWACLRLYWAHGLSGKFTEAYALLDRAQQLCEKVGDFRAGVAHVNGGHVFLAGLERDFGRSLEYSHPIIQMGKESGGFQHEVSWAYARAAEALLRLGRYQEAFDYCHQGLAISLKVSNKLEYGYAYMVLAEIHASEEYRDWDKAAWYLEESLKAFREVGAQVDVGRAHLAGARIALLRHDGTACQWAEKARDIFAERGAKALLREAKELLEELTEDQS